MAFKKKDLASFKAALKKNTSSGESLPSNYYPFHKIEFDEKCTVRFLPDKNDDNELGFLIEKFSHELNVNGQRRTVPCLKMYGHKECPICKKSAEIYKLEGEKSVTGKRLYRRKQHIGQALIVEDPLAYKEDQTPALGTVKLLNIGFTIYEKINSAFNDDELEDVPWDSENGTDFVIKRTKKGEYANYENSKFKGRPRALTEAELAVAEAGMIDLSTLIPQEPTEQYLLEMLNADLNSTPVSEGDNSASAKGTGKAADADGIDPQSSVEGVKTFNKKDDEDALRELSVAKATTTVVEDDDGDDILKQLQANRRRKTASTDDE